MVSRWSSEPATRHLAVPSVLPMGTAAEQVAVGTVGPGGVAHGEDLVRVRVRVGVRAGVRVRVRVGVGARVGVGVGVGVGIGVGVGAGAGV